jgi:hypothetical protein
MINSETQRQLEEVVPPHIAVCGEAFSHIYQNGIVEKVRNGLQSPMYLISRALVQGKQPDTFRPASYSKESISPYRGTPGNGKLRALILRHAALSKLGFSPHSIFSSSGEVQIQTGGRAHYGKIMNEELLRKGSLYRTDGSEVPLSVQELSADTIGEVFAMPGLIARLMAENGGIYPAQENRFTVYSSTDQVDRMRALEAIMYFQNIDTPEGLEAAQTKLLTFRETFRNGPVRKYLQRHRDEIISMALNGEIADTTQVLKALYLLNDVNLEYITDPTQFKNASDILYQHPRYQDTFARCAPGLKENLQMIVEKHIDIFHLTVEEIIVALDKTTAQGGKYAKLWLPEVYGRSPRNNIVASTFIGELAGTVDLLRGEYYPQGEKAQSKMKFADYLSDYYGIPLPAIN